MGLVIRFWAETLKLEFSEGLSGQNYIWVALSKLGPPKSAIFDLFFIFDDVKLLTKAQNRLKTKLQLVRFHMPAGSSR